MRNLCSLLLKRDKKASLFPAKTQHNVNQLTLMKHTTYILKTDVNFIRKK